MLFFFQATVTAMILASALGSAQTSRILTRLSFGYLTLAFYVLQCVYMFQLKFNGLNFTDSPQSYWESV